MGIAAYIVIIAIITISLAAAEMPASFYQAMNSMENENVLCVKNYRAGASVTESYFNFESLDRETEIVSRSYTDEACNATLEASINSDVVGYAHVAWQSLEQQPDLKGRHVTYGRSVEDLIGAFSIEKFILLRSNYSEMGISLDWLPCA